MNSLYILSLIVGFCVYAYGFVKIESSSYGFVIFLIGLPVFAYGVYGVIMQIF